MSVKVIDLNETVKEEQPTLEAIEEAKEEAPEPEMIDEVVEENHEEEIQQPTVEQTPQPKPKAKQLSPSESSYGRSPKPKASDVVKCDKCDKSMSYKNFRYSHNCDPKPVKKQANPKSKTKPKAVPKPPPEIYYSSSDDDKAPQQPLIKKKHSVSQPINPASVLSQHYQFLQNQMMQQKKEQYNNLCMNMFSSKSKKR